MSRSARLLVAGYGTYLLYAFWSGSLYFYIHPVYILPTVAAGLLLLGLGAVAERGGAPGLHAAPSATAVVLLAVPLALGFLLPPKPLGLATASQRGVETTPLGRNEEPSAVRLGPRPETFTIKDWVKALQADPEPARHAGKPARVTGFVYRDGQLPENWFLVARFLVQCCAVDAQPVGLPVRVRGAGVPEAGRWIAVEGFWEVAEISGQRRAVIAATTVAPTERPTQPYLY